MREKGRGKRKVVRERVMEREKGEGKRQGEGENERERGERRARVCRCGSSMSRESVVEVTRVKSSVVLGRKKILRVRE